MKRFIVATITFCILITSSFSSYVCAESVEETPIIFDGLYSIASALNTNMVLDVAGGNEAKSDGDNIQLWENFGSNNQQFVVRKMDNRYYKIIAFHSVKCIDVEGNQIASETNVQQYADNGTNAQLWEIVDAGDGYKYIIAKESGKYLDASWGGKENGNNVWIYEGNQTASQKWRFDAVNLGDKFGWKNEETRSVSTSITEYSFNKIENFLLDNLPQKTLGLFLSKATESAGIIELSFDAYSKTKSVNNEEMGAYFAYMYLMGVQSFVDNIVLLTDVEYNYEILSDHKKLGIAAKSASGGVMYQYYKDRALKSLQQIYGLTVETLVGIY